MNKTIKILAHLILIPFLFFSTQVISQNLLFNGNFESGGNGFGFNLNGAGYTLLTPPYSGTTTAGNYAFTTNPQPLNTAFFISGGDHTTGTGNMMVIDGNTTGGQQRFWRAGNTGGGVCGLTVGVTYTFRYWIKSVATTVVDNATRADIGIQFNNVSIFSLITGSALAPLPAAGWQQVVYSFVPSNACVNIELFNNNTNAVGNDFAVDDFAVLAPLQPLSINYSSTNSSCFNANDASLIVSGNGGIQPYVSYSISGPVNATNTTGVFNNLLPGTYTLSVTDSNTPPSVVSLPNVVLSQPNGLTVSPDVEICLSNSTMLNVSGGNAYNWTASPADPSLLTPTSNAPTVSPSQTTTYTVTSNVSTTQNLIFNGDFSQGNTCFTTDYFYTPVNPSGGQKIYTVGTNSLAWFFGFSNCVDHTTGTGNMMIVDGSTSNGGNDKVWCQTVSVLPGQNYTISYWVQTIALPNPANIEVLINGVSVGQAFAPGTSCLWAQRSYTWNSGTNTTAEICIYDRVTTVSGNDFALDDITFTNTITCTLSESVTVTVTTANPVTGFTYTTPICQSNAAVFSPNLATDFTTGGVFSATPSGLSINPSTGAISPSLSTPGIYEVLYAITANGCLNGGSSTFTVEIKPIPQTPDVLVTSQPNCNTTVGSIEVLSPLAGTPPPTNLFISEVTDEDVGALTYVEIFNGTGNPVNLANYKIKIYNNGNTFFSCEIPLVGILANNNVFVVSVGSVVNQGGVVPNLMVASCAGINNNDNIRLTTNTDVEIDLWGRTDGVAFTPSDLPGYTYRRLNNSNPPSLIWNPSDWLAIDPQDYTNIGTYEFLTSTYEYSIDGINYQGSTVFTGLTPGTYPVTVRDSSTGCVSNATTVVIGPIPSAPTAPTYTVISLPNCFVTTGSIEVNSPIGISFEYSIDGVNYQTQSIFSGLSEGSYSLTVRDVSTGCTSSVTTVVVSLVAGVPMPTFSIISQPSCSATGSFEVLSPLGATYNYSIDGTNYQSGVLFSGLSSGNYTVTAFNIVTGCISTGVNIVFNTIPVNPNAPTLIAQQPTCLQPLGSIQVQVPVGSSFSYALNGGTFQQSPIFSGLIPGNYSITVQDLTTGCISNSTVQVIDNLPSNPSIPAFELFQAGCDNITGGIEIISPLGSSFLYSLNNGAFQTSTSFVDLPVGTYEVVVQDTVTGCVSNPAIFEIVLLDFDVIANTPTPLTYCDPNNDNVGIFDLTSVANQVTGGAATSEISYHETFTDADLGVTPIPNPANYSTLTPTSGIQIVYIRVRSTLTGCYAVVELVLQVNPTPVLIETALPLEVCDDNADSIGVFNLTTAIPNILNGLNPALHTVSFHYSEVQAQDNTNPIANVLSFSNDVPNQQIIWVRVAITATGCFKVTPLTLTVNPKPVLPLSLPSFSLCETDPTDEREIFAIRDYVTAQLPAPGYQFAFYFSEADADNNQSPLPDNYENLTNPQTIWVVVTNETTGCSNKTVLDLRVEPRPILQLPLGGLTLCDDNGEGYGNFDLAAEVNNLLNGALGVTVTFYDTLENAELAVDAISSPYENITAYLQFIYIRAENDVTGCYSTYTLTLNVNPSPIIPVDLPNLTLCDQDGNPQSGTTAFNLTQQNAIILAAQPAGLGSYTIRYFTTEANAQNNTAAIVNTTSFINGPNPQTIWYRVSNNTSNCFSIGTFQLIVNTPLALTTPTPLAQCNPDNDNFMEFDLTTKDAEITQGLPGYTVTYYPSYAQALTEIGPITNPTAYTNLTPAQTLGVVVTSPQGCKSFISLTIRVLPTPIVIAPPLLEVCDNTNPGDNEEAFDLTTHENIIRNNDPDITFAYFPTQADAIAGTNQIMVPTTYVSATGSVWVMAMNQQQPTPGTFCYTLVEQLLQVNPLPQLVAFIPDYVICEPNTDNIATFTLNTLNDQVMESGDATGFTISYYETQADAAAGTNALANSYANTSNPQTIYIRVVNNQTGCVNATTTVNLVVEEGAIANPIPADTAGLTVCDEDGTNDGQTQFDLTPFGAITLGTQSPTDYAVSYYETQADALAGTKAIANPSNYTNTNNPQEIWIRVTNATTVSQCAALSSIQLTVNLLPEIMLNDGFICLDPVTLTPLGTYTIDTNIANPELYSYVWYFNGDELIGAIDSSYTTTEAGIYEVVATNIATGCSMLSPAMMTLTNTSAAIVTDADVLVSEAFSQNQTITVNVTGGLGDYEYQLDNGPFQDSNMFVNVSAGTHTITIRDKNDGGCNTLIIIKTAINYPLFFTPNGDNHNDTWNITGLGNQPNAKIYIFDRYGKLLKQISPTSNGWDGTFNGQPLPSTDYWFTVTFEENNETKEFKAHFSLKR